jgi:hypothetical protein
MHLLQQCLFAFEIAPQPHHENAGRRRVQQIPAGRQSARLAQPKPLRLGQLAQSFSADAVDAIGENLGLLHVIW